MRSFFRSRWRAFAGDRRGNIAIIFALAAIPMVLAIGIVIDYVTAVRARSTLQQAADAAALGASRTAADYLSTNGWTTANLDPAVAAGKTAAQQIFAANVADIAFSSGPTMTPTITAQLGQPIVTTVTASGEVATSLMKIGGFTAVDLATTSSAQAGSNVKFYQFVFLVDVSGSMTIGGTDADNTKLTSTYYNSFKDSTDCPRKSWSSYGQCAFACHDPNNIYPCKSYPDKKARRTTAKSLGIKLKIDYVQSAIDTFLSTVDTAVTSANADATASIYSFASSFNTVATNVTLSAARTSAAAMQIETIDSSNNWGYTYTTSALTSLAAKLTNVGDGTSKTKRKTYVVFLTDGLEDVSGSCSGYGRCTGVSYTTGCAKVKAVNSSLTLVSIEATYPVVTGDTQYNTIVAPYATSMKTAMKTCATGSSWYFAADDGPGIESAMTTVINQITNTLRITQ
jgi:Flp pilus assembly protein TadG